VGQQLEVQIASSCAMEEELEVVELEILQRKQQLVPA
jgi:hypothetical protein